MDYDTRNPCDLCKRKKCFDVDDDFVCAFDGYTSKYTVQNCNASLTTKEVAW